MEVTQSTVKTGVKGSRRGLGLGRNSEVLADQGAGVKRQFSG